MNFQPGTLRPKRSGSGGGGEPVEGKGIGLELLLLVEAVHSARSQAATAHTRDTSIGERSKRSLVRCAS